ncbi:unnamed protein product [Orchesella dallaii]|uniref:PDZ domain-containing protein n=1 Tax=Orchesella dallaii TaxID=48710 RepID=A0ABP1R5I1_9HEXA
MLMCLQMDNRQHIVVSDQENQRVQLFDRYGNFLRKYAVFDRFSEFDQPRGVIFDGTDKFRCNLFPCWIISCDDYAPAFFVVLCYVTNVTKVFDHHIQVLMNRRIITAQTTSPSSQSRRSGNENRNMVFQSKLSFRCRQAHGSDVGNVTGFSDLKELYQKLADYYGIPISEILFCTRNAHHVDMNNLLETEVFFDDFIFVHQKGFKKEIMFTKSERVLGLTITDNGNGHAFIKGIVQGSTAHEHKRIQVGDHIEGIDNKNLVGSEHIEVANYLKNIPAGQSFVLHLVEPLKAPDGIGKTAITRINELLLNFMGCVDTDLATKLYEMSMNKDNANELAAAVDSCELEYFGFNDDFLLEVWGIINDAKAERLVG